MAGAIGKFLAEPSYGVKLGSSAFKKVKDRYSWSVIIREMENYYLHLLKH
jgi:glycosyltransferase involved in cell wall biosynthesis